MRDKKQSESKEWSTQVDSITDLASGRISIQGAAYRMKGDDAPIGVHATRFVLQKTLEVVLSSISLHYLLKRRLLTWFLIGFFTGSFYIFLCFLISKFFDGLIYWGFVWICGSILVYAISKW